MNALQIQEQMEERERKRLSSLAETSNDLAEMKKAKRTEKSGDKRKARRGSGSYRFNSVGRDGAGHNLLEQKAKRLNDQIILLAELEKFTDRLDKRRKNKY